MPPPRASTAAAGTGRGARQGGGTPARLLHFLGRSRGGRACGALLAAMCRGQGSAAAHRSLWRRGGWGCPLPENDGASRLAPARVAVPGHTHTAQRASNTRGTLRGQPCACRPPCTGRPHWRSPGGPGELESSSPRKGSGACSHGEPGAFVGEADAAAWLPHAAGRGTLLARKPAHARGSGWIRVATKDALASICRPPR